MFNYQVVNAQNYVFYFESDIAKVFPFRPTCSSYDSEREKSQKVSQRGPEKKESEQMWQAWINSMGKL
jgi:hypothetical protein